ncbi:polysaccharide biosynthesis/export family protein [Aeoliella sp.]|uniref:polysaccharide biosynthesis/export family protein n=1 Tax=Aeoliella sp. TaxID=2795800 RepID=UPI003CCB8164
MSDDNRSKFRFRFSLRTLLIAMVAFVIGFATRNVVEGLRPFAMQFSIPASTTPVAPGETLIVELGGAPDLSRTVTVQADSTIKLPLVGTVDVAEQDVSQVEATLNKEYGKFYVTPGVEVFREENYARPN